MQILDKFALFLCFLIKNAGFPRVWAWFWRLRGRFLVGLFDV